VPRYVERELSAYWLAAASTMRRLGMSLRAIGAALGVDEKTVRKSARRSGVLMTTNLQRREVRRVRSPAARAARSAVR
jgi:hypothetical protein